MDQQHEEKLKEAGFPLLLLLIGLGAAGLSLFIFSELAEDILASETIRFDAAVVGLFVSISSEPLDQAMILITELGSVWFLTALSLMVLAFLWVRYRDKWGILFFAIGVAGGGILTKILKSTYERSRPGINPDIDAVGYSFPSGHAMGSLVFYGFAIYFIVRSRLSRTAKWLGSITSGVLIILIGISRIYLGAHYPSDVAAGYSAGLIWLAMAVLALEYVEWHTRNNIRPVRALRNLLSDLI
ncbi:phosphatase PAP2 family protein [Bacillus marinisedimentorum]|uniref:phosphatase PAP2 family protein n=1 Tax=Bacillus marinisedimentorum TaxID=1821260 RepID=UPI000872F1F7|nr:phosphatase PAP2 family protein [Bacillus marinisedimentorum]